MSAHFNVLVVCTGNICRSPLAEGLFRLQLDAAVGGLSGACAIASAGTQGLDGALMDPHAADELRRMGGSADEFRARNLTEMHVMWSDLVLTATRQHRSAVLAESPQALRRTFTLREFADLAPYEAHASKGSMTARLRALVAHAAQRRGSATLTEYDVPDPYRQSAEAHRHVADLIARAVTDVVNGWSTALAAPRSTQPEERARNGRTR